MNTAPAASTPTKLSAALDAALRYRTACEQEVAREKPFAGSSYEFAVEQLDDADAIVEALRSAAAVGDLIRHLDRTLPVSATPYRNRRIAEASRLALASSRTPRRPPEV